MALLDARMQIDYRGVVLPRGMTKACMDDVAREINHHQFEDNEQSDAACAAIVFSIVKAHLDKARG